METPLRNRRVAGARIAIRQLHALALRDDAAHLLRRLQQRGAVVSALQLRLQLAQDAADRSIGQILFEPVADFDARLLVFDDQQEHHAFVRSLLADAPTMEEPVRPILDWLVGESGNRDQRDLHSGGAFEPAAVGDDRIAAGSVDHTREVAHIPLRLELRRIRSGVRSRIVCPERNSAQDSQREQVEAGSKH